MDNEFYTQTNERNQLQTLLEQRYPLIYLANPTARIRIQS